MTGFQIAWIVGSVIVFFVGMFLVYYENDDDFMSFVLVALVTVGWPVLLPLALAFYAIVALSLPAKFAAAYVRKRELAKESEKWRATNFPPHTFDTEKPA